MLNQINEIIAHLKHSKTEFLTSDFVRNIDNINYVSEVLQSSELLKSLYLEARKSIPKIQKNNMKLKLQNFINWTADNTILDNDITNIDYNLSGLNLVLDSCIDTLIIVRQSVNKGYTDKQDTAEHTNLKYAEERGFKPYVHRVTKSGFHIVKDTLQILTDNPNIKYIMAESIDRLARNSYDLHQLLDFAMKNRIEIYNNNQLANRGSSLLLTQVLGVFAEFELKSKITSFSKDVLNVVKFELGHLQYNDLTASEQTFLKKMQHVDKDFFLTKAYLNAKKYNKNYITEALSEDNKRLANNPKLNDMAIETMVLCEDFF